MKKILIILGFIGAILAVIFSVTPLYNVALMPLIVAFVCGIALVFMTKTAASKPKAIQYIFLLVIIALSITIYKAVFNTSEIGDIEQLEQRDEQNLEDSKELLEDIEIDEDF
ncbi:FUSC family protein [Winogradskyella rapida]|uniref:FUSC family protein n=1 Tax=Winogradskyella rapida TaxID=549701 RepID=A0ABW3KN13_9FLAO